eukprot:TRINITY_DN684_c0_g2_i2.p3 TRINITY_DN684_c0_g2~~TRINITY_DN684_c0_g2_i2.p3  ORF type:complete len:100 (-),score=2.89 TRINITY_DN684_c0_g2_i2:62-361(-)
MFCKPRPPKIASRKIINQQKCQQRQGEKRDTSHRRRDQPNSSFAFHWSLQRKSRKIMHSFQDYCAVINLHVLLVCAKSFMKILITLLMSITHNLSLIHI